MQLSAIFHIKLCCSGAVYSHKSQLYHTGGTFSRHCRFGFFAPDRIPVYHHSSQVDTRNLCANLLTQFSVWAE